MASLAAAVSLLTAALVTATPVRDEGQVAFALNVDLVVFNVTVTDGQGRHVTGLNAGDFRVIEDHRPQDIRLFRAEDVPASVGLLVDNSGSMRDRHADVAAAALVFVGASNAADELFVITFNERVTLGLPPETPFTGDPDRIRSALLGTAPDGTTALYDALAAGLEHIQTGTRERKALVVLSDGGDNASRRRLDDVLEMAQRSSATIYAIGIYDELDRDQNPGVLRRLARVTGGRAYFPARPGDLVQVWRDIAGGIRSQYTIGYYSTDHRRDGQFRPVTITAGRHTGRGLRVTTRPGYRSPDGGTPR